VVEEEETEEGRGAAFQVGRRRIVFRSVSRRRATGFVIDN